MLGPGYDVRPSVRSGALTEVTNCVNIDYVELLRF